MWLLQARFTIIRLAIYPEWSSCISWNFVVTPVASAFCCVSVLLNVTKKRLQQSISMVTTTIMHGFVNTASTLQHQPYGYIPRTVQLYQLKFCGYACSQYIPSCFSVAKRHQEAVPTVNIDGHDDYASCMDMWLRQARFTTIRLYSQNGSAVSVEILWLRL